MSRQPFYLEIGLEQIDGHDRIHHTLRPADPVLQLEHSARRSSSSEGGAAMGIGSVEISRLSRLGIQVSDRVTRRERRACHLSVDRQKSGKACPAVSNAEVAERARTRLARPSRARLYAPWQPPQRMDGRPDRVGGVGLGVPPQPPQRHPSPSRWPRSGLAFTASPAGTRGVGGGTGHGFVTVATRGATGSTSAPSTATPAATAAATDFRTSSPSSTPPNLATAPSTEPPRGGEALHADVQQCTDRRRSHASASRATDRRRELRQPRRRRRGGTAVVGNGGSRG